MIEKDYQWNVLNTNYGLKVIINEHKEYKMYLKCIDHNFNYTEIDVDIWTKYIGSNVICDQISRTCTRDIYHEIMLMLLTNCSDDKTNYYSMKQISGKDVIWLKCRYVDNIEISIFYPQMNCGFMIREIGFEDSFNCYEDQIHRIRKLATDNLAVAELYSWVLDESLKYFKPIVYNALIGSISLNSSLVSIISDYVIS